MAVAIVNCITEVSRGSPADVMTGRGFFRAPADETSRVRFGQRRIVVRGGERIFQAHLLLLPRIAECGRPAGGFGTENIRGRIHIRGGRCSPM